MYTGGETIQERCRNQPILTREIGAGTYVLQTSPRCVISSSNGWQYQALYIDDLRFNISDLFMLDVPNLSGTAMNRR